MVGPALTPVVEISKPLRQKTFQMDLPLGHRIGATGHPLSHQRFYDYKILLRMPDLTISIGGHRYDQAVNSPDSAHTSLYTLLRYVV